MKRLWILSLLLAVVIISGCYGAKTKDAGVITTTQEAAPQAPAAATGTEGTGVQQAANAVEIKGFAFNPATITVSKGTTITWTQQDSAPHTVTTTDAPVAFDSGSLSKGGTFSYTFDTSGTYEYYCSIHPSMKAKVIVQ